MVDRERFDRAGLMARLAELGVVPLPEEIEATLRRLDLAFVLGRESGDFRFRVLLFQDLVRDEVVYLDREVEAWRRRARA